MKQVNRDKSKEEPQQSMEAEWLGTKWRVIWGVKVFVLKMRGLFFLTNGNLLEERNMNSVRREKGVLIRWKRMEASMQIKRWPCTRAWVVPFLQTVAVTDH